jgi:hypothetical protein
VCNDESRCFQCEEAEHANVHPDFDDPDCETCRLRSIQLNPRTVSPSSRNQIAPTGTDGRNSWEKGVALDHRGIPYRDKHGAQIPVKKFAEKRQIFKESIRRNRLG